MDGGAVVVSEGVDSDQNRTKRWWMNICCHYRRWHLSSAEGATSGGVSAEDGCSIPPSRSGEVMALEKSPPCP
jgi:hypothetical protein